jgi:hypothetical protein
MAPRASTPSPSSLSGLAALVGPDEALATIGEALQVVKEQCPAARGNPLLEAGERELEKARAGEGSNALVLDAMATEGGRIVKKALRNPSEVSRAAPAPDPEPAAAAVPQESGPTPVVTEGSPEDAPEPVQAVTPMLTVHATPPVSGACPHA